MSARRWMDRGFWAILMGIGFNFGGWILDRTDHEGAGDPMFAAAILMLAAAMVCLVVALILNHRDR